MKKSWIWVGFLSLLFFTYCGDQNTNYKQEIENWHTKRLESLKSEDGWLNLAGLYWLDEGTNKAGSDSSYSIVFPGKAPDYLGEFVLEDDSVRFIAADDVDITNNQKQVVNQTTMNHDLQKNTTRLNYGSLRWFVIKRGDEYGIRLRDLESPLIDQLDSIPAFPVDPNWKVKAEYVPFEEERYLEVPNVLGGTNEERVHGKLKFSIKDQEFSLVPLGSGDRLFLIFADGTNAEETYGGGRFLSVPGPNDKGITYIDFNKAYNPPCAFTPYATCPLPPRENILNIRVEAGEKSPGIDVPHH